MAPTYGQPNLYIYASLSSEGLSASAAAGALCGEEGEQPAVGSPAAGPRPSRWTPTLVKARVSSASKAISPRPAEANHARICGVRSGGRRCRVQITVARRGRRVSGGAEGQHTDQRRGLSQHVAASALPSRASPGRPGSRGFDHSRRVGRVPAPGVVTCSRSRGRGSYVSCRWRAVRARRADGDDDPSRAPRLVSAPRALWFLRCRDAWCAGDGGPGTWDCWSGDPCGA